MSSPAPELPDYSSVPLDLSSMTPEMLQAAIPPLDTTQLGLVLDAVRQATQANLDAQQKVAAISLALQQSLAMAGFVMTIARR